MKKIYKWILKHKNPKKYAEKTGVSFVDLHVYGYVDWGTEPWIISLGKNVHITDGVKFITHDGGVLLLRDRQPNLDITAPIVLGDNVYVGNNVIILPGVTIGNNVIIGAGSIVTKDIPNDSVVAGIPACRIESFEEYYQKALKKSTNLGKLKRKEKDDALKKYFGCNKKTKGIYF